MPDTPRLSHEPALTELLQPTLISHQHLPLLQEHNNETSVGAGNGEVALNSKAAQRPSAEIYHVTAPVFLRNSPTAEAEITTIELGTRIAVTRVSNEYFGVRSLADPKVSGFVHREDAFFERTQ